MKVNRRIQQLVGSTTLAITARAKELLSQGKDVVNFAAGEPDFDTPPDIKAAGIKAIQDGFTKYTPSIGTPQLREAIAAKFLKDNNLTYKPSQIAVSCGAKHSIFNIIQVLADEGEEVLIPAPYWVSYPEMVKFSGARSVFIPTTAKSDFKITPAGLQAHINSKTKLLVLCSPSNPTGSVYSRQELESIAEICVKHKIYVISDEIYEKLVYDGLNFISFAALGKDIYDLTLTVNGVSKAYSMTGWRIGYCGGPQEVIDYVNKFQDHSTSNPTSISQMAAMAALKSPEESIKAMCREFEARRDLMLKCLDAVPGVSYVRPQGAFYVFCDFSKFGAADAVAKQILDEVNVALIPGEGFGAPGFLRLSFATSQEKIKEGIKRIGEWAKKNAPVGATSLPAAAVKK